MINKIKKIKKDPLAYIFLKIREPFVFVYIFICSIYTILLAWLKRINIKGVPRCHGVPYLMRNPNSSIHIGTDFLINSSFKSNNIGMFSRSRITTNYPNAIIEIGSHVGMSSVTISAFKKIVIGNNTLIGGNVLITDSDWHAIDPFARFHQCEGSIKMADVVIGENVFIGTRSIILKGSIIGNNSIIGAGSVVRGVIPANVIACGNPCKVIKQL